MWQHAQRWCAEAESGLRHETDYVRLFNSTDPMKPSDVEIFSAAEVLISGFNGDFGKAILWAIDEAIRFNTKNDGRRSVIAVRLSRTIKEIPDYAPCSAAFALVQIMNIQQLRVDLGDGAQQGSVPERAQ